MATRNAGIDIDDVPTNTGRPQSPKVEDLVEVEKFKPKVWTDVRLFGALFARGMHWVQTKKRDGSLGAFSARCLAFNSQTGRVDSTIHCPWCAFQATEQNQVEKGKKPPVALSVSYYVNALFKKHLKNLPEEIEPTREELKTGFKDKDSDTPTPIRVVRLSKSLIVDIRNAKGLNTHEIEGEEKAMSILDLRYGRWVKIMYDPDQAMAKQYSIQIGDPTSVPLKKRKWMIWDLSSLQEDPPEDMEEALEEEKAEFTKWAVRMGFKKGKPKADDDDDGDASETPKKKKRSVEEDLDDDPPPKKKRVVDEDADDLDDDPPPKKKRQVIDEDADDLDDDPPKKKRAVIDDDLDDDPPPKKKRAVIDEEDEDEEKPKAKKKPKAEDLDADDLDDDPPKPKKKPKVEDFDEDEEEKPKAKKKAVSVDDDLDEEEEEKPKAKKKPKAEDLDDDDPPPKKKKKPVDDDFEDLLD